MASFSELMSPVSGSIFRFLKLICPPSRGCNTTSCSCISSYWILHGAILAQIRFDLQCTHQDLQSLGRIVWISVSKEMSAQNPRPFSDFHLLQGSKAHVRKLYR